MKKKFYINIGENVIIKKDEILGIFDLDRITVFSINKKYLSNLDKLGKLNSSQKYIPKSCILCCNKDSKSEKIYLSHLLTSTIFRRL